MPVSKGPDLPNNNLITSQMLNQWQNNNNQKIVQITMHGGMQKKHVTVIIIILTLMLIANSQADLPIVSRQYTLVGSIGPSRFRSFINTLSPPYGSEYSRNLILAGLDVRIKYQILFDLAFGSGTATSQVVKVVLGSATTFYQVSVYIVFIKSNNWIWALSQSYKCTQINAYAGFTRNTATAQVQSPTIPFPAAVMNNSGIKVSAYVTWYKAVSRYATPFYTIMIDMKAEIVGTNSISVTFSRSANQRQLLLTAGYVLILINQTQLLINNFAYTLISINSGPTNLPISTIFLNSTYGGYDGNCLIGYRQIQLGGNLYVYAQRGYLFNAKSNPYTINTKYYTGDAPSFIMNTMCFNNIVCPSLTYFNPTTLLCSSCSITNCTTCLTYSMCATCNQYNGQTATLTCLYCPNLAPGCLQCANSTYCTSCLTNQQYVFQSNSCPSCSQFIPGCLTCGNITDCITCIDNTFYLDSSNQCPSCSTVIPYCLQCTNSTNCVACSVGYYMNAYTINGTGSNNATNSTNSTNSTEAVECLLCSIPMTNCSQCTNDTICLGCAAGYYLTNNSCLSCLDFLPNCTVCTNPSTCTVCAAEFYVLGGGCSLCSSAINQCLQCSSATVCTICNVSHYVNSSNQCQQCTTLNFCRNCTSSTTCIECETNYLLFAGVCYPCSFALANCQTCDNQTYCTSCQTDTYYIKIDLGLCLPCSASVISCETCMANNISNTSAIICTSCYSPLFLNNNTQCQTCGSAIDNCASCPNGTFCDTCVSDSYGYQISINSCIPCDQIFQNCSTCTLTECTKCQSMFRLTNQGRNCSCILGQLVAGVCNDVVGCVLAKVYPDGYSGCLQCDTTTFFKTPVYGHCQCLYGTLIGKICCTIPNCIAAIVSASGVVQCIFCSVNRGYSGTPVNNTICVCQPHTSSNGTYCVDTCGDGFLLSTDPNACDDGNLVNGDGCSSNCTIEAYYRCTDGNVTHSSNCIYTGVVGLSMKNSTRVKGQNISVFQFNVYPPLAIAKMNLTNYVSLQCVPNYSVGSIRYASGVLIISALYPSDTIAPCNVTMAFNQSLASSQPTTFLFNSEPNKMPQAQTSSDDLSSNTDTAVYFKLLGLITVALFVLSLSHKMIGAQLMVCCQVVYLSNFFYSAYSSFNTTVSNLGVVTGGWSLFYSKQYQNLLPSFTDRVQISPYFIQNTLFLIGTLILISILGLLYHFYLLLPNCKEQQQDIKKKKKKQKPSLIQKVPKVLYRCFAFPVVSGFFIVVSIAGFVQGSRLSPNILGSFSSSQNTFAQLFVWIIVAATFGVQVFAKMALKGSISLQFSGLQRAKKWYIPLFLIKLILLTALIQVGIYLSFSVIIYGIAFLDTAYLLVLVIGRPYNSILDNIGAIVCVLTECSSIALPIVKKWAPKLKIIFQISPYLLLGFLSGCIFLSLIRVIIEYKNVFQQCKSGKSKEKYLYYLKKDNLNQPQTKQDQKQDEVNIIDHPKVREQKQFQYPYSYKDQNIKSYDMVTHQSKILMKHFQQRRDQKMIRQFQNANISQIQELAKQKKRLKDSLIQKRKKYRCIQDI